MSTSGPIIRVNSVVEYIGGGESGQPLLDHVSIEVPPATSVGIMGPPRSGKSTLARLMAGQTSAYRGGVEITGHVSWAPSFPLRLMPSLTLRDYVHFVAQMYQADPDQVLDNVNTLCGFPEGRNPALGEFDRLGRGKLAIALKYALDFDCYILDEPSFTNDQTFRALTETYTERLRGRRSVVFFAKSERPLRRFCDVIYRLEAGSLQGPEATAPLPQNGTE